MKMKLSLETRLILYYIIGATAWFLIFDLYITRIGYQTYRPHLQSDLLFVFATTFMLNYGLRFTINRLQQKETQLLSEKIQRERLFEQLPLVVWSTNTALKINTSGGTALNFLPYDAARYLQSLAQPFFDSPDCYNAHKDALKGLSGDCHVRFSEHIFDVRIEPLRSYSGEIIGCIGVALDLTDTIQTHQELIESEARFRSLVSSMDDIVFTLDSNHRCTGVYGRWLKDRNLTPDYSLGKTLHQIFRGNSSHVHETANQRALKGEKVIYNWHNQEDDETRYYQTRLSPIYDASHKIAGIVGVGRDITEQKLAERSLEEYRQQLESQVDKRTAALQYEIQERTRLQKEEYRQRRIAETLRSMALMLTQTLDLDTILDGAMDNIKHVLKFDGVTIMLINDGSVNVLRAHHKNVSARTHNVQFNPGSVPYLRKMMLSQEAAILTNEDRWQQEYWAKSHDWIKSAIGTPLVIRDEVCGFVILASEEANFYSYSELETLKFFGSHLSAAIRNANVHQQAQVIAVENERNRIARDLHDAVTQTLFSANMVAETLINIPKDDTKQMNHGLENLRHLTRGALAEMRALLLELRPQAIEKTDFDTLIHQQADAFFSRTQIPVNIHLATLPLLVPKVKLTLYRILQEALNNIDKHARASKVDIKTNWHQDTLSLMITDNGRGFDEQNTSHGMGLNIMAERAQTIGATFEVASNPPEGGTSIHLSLVLETNYDTHFDR